MKKLILFGIFALIMIGCQNESPVDIFSDSHDLFTESLAKKTAPDGFVIHEPGFEGFSGCSIECDPGKDQPREVSADVPGKTGGVWC